MVTRLDAPLLLQVRVASARAIGGLIISLDVRDTKLEGLAPCLPHLLQVNVDAVSSGDQVCACLLTRHSCASTFCEGLVVSDAVQAFGAVAQRCAVRCGVLSVFAAAVNAFVPLVPLPPRVRMSMRV